jgi:hypothetical protein
MMRLMRLEVLPAAGTGKGSLMGFLLPKVTVQMKNELSLKPGFASS